MAYDLWETIQGILKEEGRPSLPKKRQIASLDKMLEKEDKGVMDFSRVDTMDFSRAAITQEIVKHFGSLESALFDGTSKMISDAVERLYSKYTGGQVYNGEGFDVIMPDNSLHEVKYTRSDQNGYLRVGGLSNKEGKCNTIAIIDGIHNRIFAIPTQTFYNCGEFAVGRNWHEFHWSLSYNETDRKKIWNTKLLLEFEIN